VSEDVRILRVGLTGGIASGKTTVSHIFAEHGAFVVEADDLAHAVIEPGQAAHGPVVQRFGNGILDEEGRIVRSRLASLIFHDAEARAALNAIVHPEVRAEFQRQIEQYAPGERAPIVVFDAALLVETGAYRDFHRLVVARCSVATQIHRLVARDGLGVDEARARIAAQAPVDSKVSVADYVIDTDGTLRETRLQTDRVYTSLVGDFEQEFPGNA